MTSALWDRMQIENPTLYAVCRDPPDEAKDNCTLLIEDYFSNICNDPQNYGTQVGCKTFCETKPHLCRGIDEKYRNYCNTGTGFTQQHCQDWCLMNPGYCNTGAREFCAKPSSAEIPICSCINSQMNGIQGLIPECHDIDCYRWGYKTMTPTTCPSYVSCDTKLQVEDVMGDVDIRGVTIETNCGDSSGGVNTGSNNTNGNANTGNIDIFADQKIIILLVFIIFVFVAIFIVRGKINFGKFGGNDFSDSKKY